MRIAWRAPSNRALKTALGGEPGIEMDLPLLKTLPDRLRKWRYEVRCVLFKEGRRWRLIHLTDARDPRPPAGLAVDIGTTRVVLRLVDLATGPLPGRIGL